MGLWSRRQAGLLLMTFVTQVLLQTLDIVTDVYNGINNYLSTDDQLRFFFIYCLMFCGSNGCRLEFKKGSTKLDPKFEPNP